MLDGFQSGFDLSTAQSILGVYAIEILFTLDPNASSDSVDHEILLVCL